MYIGHLQYAPDKQYLVILQNKKAQLCSSLLESLLTDELGQNMNSVTEKNMDLSIMFSSCDVDRCPYKSTSGARQMRTKY